MPPAAPAKLETQNIYGLELLRVGAGNGREYTKEDIDGVIDGFKKLGEYGYKPTAKLGHNPQQHLLTADGLPAAGTVEEMYLSADGQAAVVDVANVPKKVAQFIEVKGYGPRSSELWLDKALIPGQPNIPIALKSFAWLGADAPALKNLNDIEALYHEDELSAETLAALDALWHRPMEPSVYLDDKGEVSVIVNAQSDDGGAEPGGGMAANGTPAKDSDPPNHGPRTGTHSHAHAAYDATNAVNTGGGGQHKHSHTHSGDATHSPSASSHDHTGMGGAQGANSANSNPETPDDIVVNAEADGTHAAMTGKHTHEHAAHGAAGAEDGMHGHEHAHQGDADHSPDSTHDHSDMTANNSDLWAGADIFNKEFSKDERDKLAKSGKAMPDGSYPIETVADLENAVQAYGRSPDESTKAHIIKRAKALGATDKLPASWPGSTAKDADAKNADLDSEDSWEDVIGDLYTAMTGMGGPFQNQYPRIIATFPDCCIVKTSNWDGPMDGDEHWMVPYTRESGGEPVIGTPTPANITFAAASAQMSESGAEPQITEGETVNDAEYRKFWGLTDDADVKQHMIGLRTSTVSLADHNATIERLNKIEANAKLTEATAKVEKMKASGQIAGPKETVDALEKFAIDLCLSDPERFDVWMANQPKVIDYSVQGLAEDGADPNVSGAVRSYGPQAQRDLAAANAAMGVTQEQIAARQGTSFDMRREAAVAKAREANPALNFENRELGRVFHSR